MSEAKQSHLLPTQIEKHLAALSKLYSLEGEQELQSLIVNAQIRVHEEWDFDNWNGGTYGHALYLTLPEQIYLKSARQLEDLQSKIKDDLNKIQNIPNEFISVVFIEMMERQEYDWRRESGQLLVGGRSVSEAATQRIWKEGSFRLFMSHKSEDKLETAKLKKMLENYGISSFVAHEDIHPTEAWQTEIENALATMDGFLAIMTEGFHNSDWTDQEVGFAYARGVPMIALRVGMDPYGFIGKFQGLKASWLEAPSKIAKLLIRDERMFSSWLKEIRECWGFDHGNRLSELLPSLTDLTEDQIDELVASYNAGGQVTGSYGFTGSKPRSFGHGLLFHLNRLSSRKFENSDWKVVEANAQAT